MAKNWIAGAIKKPGALTKTAKAKGKTVKEMIKSPGNVSPKTKKRIALAKTLSSMKKK